MSPAGSGCISITAEAGPAGGGPATEAEEALSQQLSESRLRGDALGGEAQAHPSGQPGGAAQRKQILVSCRVLQEGNVKGEEQSGGRGNGYPCVGLWTSSR